MRFNEEIQLDKLYPNRVKCKTSKSKFDIQYEIAQKEGHNKHGISFYCPKRDVYMFIENNKI